jgi:hypothetical protein
MEQQLYGSSSRSREDDSRVISGKSRSLAGESDCWHHRALGPRLAFPWILAAPFCSLAAVPSITSGQLCRFGRLKEAICS